MACTAALLAALGLVTLLLTGQAAPPTPRQGAELRFMGSEVDYNVQVENITASNLKLQTNYKLRKPQGEPPQKQLPKDLDFVDDAPNLASEDYSPDDGPASLHKPQKPSTGRPKKYTPIPPPNPQVYVLPTEDVRLVFPDDDENDMAAGIRAVDEELGRPSDLHAIILESGEDADTFSRALHEYQSRNYHSRTEPEEPYHAQVTQQHPQLYLQSHPQPLYSSPHQQLPHQALEQPSPWQMLPQQKQLQHRQPAFQKQYQQPYQQIPEMVLRPAVKTRRSSRVRRSVALNEEGALFLAGGRQKRGADDDSEEEYDSEEKGSDEKPHKRKTKQPGNVRRKGSFESDEVRKPAPAPKPSKVSTTQKTNIKPQKPKVTLVPKTTTKPALIVTTKKPVKVTPFKPIPSNIPTTPATTTSMNFASVTEAGPASATALLTEQATSVEDLLTTLTDFVAATDAPQILHKDTNAPVSGAKTLASQESSEDSAEDPSTKDGSVENSSELTGSLDESRESKTRPPPQGTDYNSFEESSEHPDSSELDGSEYSKSIEDSSEYPDSVEKSSKSPDSKENSLEDPESTENSSESPDNKDDSSEDPGSEENSVEVPDSLENSSETSMSLEKSSEIENSSEYPDSSENYIDSTEGQKEEFKKSDSSEDSAEIKSVESTERASMESMEGGSLESTEMTSIESMERASLESIKKASMESIEKASIESTDKTSSKSSEKTSMESTEKASLESSVKTSIESTERASLESMEEDSIENTEKASLENTNYPSMSVTVERASMEIVPSMRANDTQGVEPKHASQTQVPIETNELDDLKSYFSVENDVDNTKVASNDDD